VKVLAVLLFLAFGFGCSRKKEMAEEPADPFLWLENIEGGQAMEWVEGQNRMVFREFGRGAGYEGLRGRLLEIATSPDRIPYVGFHAGWLYNFWTDEKRPRGVWRRTTPDQYRTPDPLWEELLDFDLLGEEEGVNWVWAGADFLPPDGDRALVSLSRGGADAVEVREFDLSKGDWVPGGFRIPEAKTSVSWIDADSIYVATGDKKQDLTRSGYPRTIRRWSRGTPLPSAPVVFQGQPSDVMVVAGVGFSRGRKFETVVRMISFFESEIFLRTGEEWSQLPVPPDAGLSFFGDYLLVSLRSPWELEAQSFFPGTLLAGKISDVLAGNLAFQTLFEPGPRRIVGDSATTENFLVLEERDQLRSSVFALAYGSWEKITLDLPTDEPSFGPWNPYEGDELLVYGSNFLTPASVWRVDVADPSAGPELLRAAPERFNKEGLVTQLHEAVSADGTVIPYWQIGPAEQSEPLPVLMHAYGGFSVPMEPGYDSFIGAAWLERGRVYVVPVLRGGGEFGPEWHEAARGMNRDRVFEDAIAVAEDLVRRGVTTPGQLAFTGGSNGGLLAMVLATRRPDLFGAVVAEVPLTDMRRYHRLLAGASWMDEYGDPDDPAVWEYLKSYSPYHNVQPDADYPPVLLTSSTRDDRVHPGHARKMVALFQSQGHPAFYYENTEGGHGGAADASQAAKLRALAHVFLDNHLLIDREREEVKAKP
jgi:prolyl oligopeptidase